MLDLPQRLSPGWQPLVTITGNEQIYAETARATTARNRWSASWSPMQRIPGSMLTSIARAREIARTVRDILPREVWEQINELYLYVAEHAAEAAAKRTRYAFSGSRHRCTQTLTGMFEGMFNEGDALSFLTLGRNIERADMTSRIVDVRAAAMMAGADRRGAAAVRDGAVDERAALAVGLSNVSPEDARARARGREWCASCWPRSIFRAPACAACAAHEEVLHRLPQQRAAGAPRGAHAPRAAPHALRSRWSRRELHDFIDRLQLSLARTNDELARIYFVGHSSPVGSAIELRIVAYQDSARASKSE